MHHFDWLTGFIFPYINFAIFFILAVKFFRKPLLDMMAKRRVEFENLVNEADKARRDAEAKSQELQHRLTNLDQEIRRIVDEGRTNAEREAAALVAKANSVAEQIQIEVKRTAEAEVKAARDQLRREIVQQISDNISKRLLEVGDGDHTMIITQQVKEFANLKSGA